jgi:glycosyltransferase involved in cell wall biosynthesis
MRIAAFTRYDRQAASTRQRFIQYFPSLRDAGIYVRHLPLLDDQYVAALVTGTSYPNQKIAQAYVRRMRQLAMERAADIYWVYVELLPFVPAYFERLAAAGKKIVYDFDDAFFHTYDQSSNAFVRTFLSNKHASLLEHAAACVCGNTYVWEFAQNHCRNSIIVPTVVDTRKYRAADEDGRSSLTIGWMGSPTTWPQVRPILHVLEEVAKTFGARILVIGAGRGAKIDAFPGLEFRDWAEETEISDVQDMDVGIMPLKDGAFERGKSGYKLIQYMACGLPVVASPVGVNAEIVRPGMNGFLASTEEDWRAALSLLLRDSQLRKRLGESGRQQVERDFSLASQESKLIELFQSLA